MSTDWTCPMKLPEPSLREQIALFRRSVIGDLLVRELERGELEAELEKRSKKRYRPPGLSRTRTYAASTLERWYYAAKADPVEGLMPKSRARGVGQIVGSDAAAGARTTVTDEGPAAVDAGQAPSPAG